MSENILLNTQKSVSGETVLKIVSLLEEVYPEAQCSLLADEPWKLMCAVRLSAQCTDARVNIVTEELFSRYPTPEALASAPYEDIEAVVRPCGLSNTKAKNLKDMCTLLVEKYNGILPDSMEALLSFPGVGRKSANLLLGDVHHRPGSVVCDTHCIRITNRLGWISTTDPAKAEICLRALLPPEKSNDFCHRLVIFGREICSARSPRCSQCPLAALCPSSGTHSVSE